MKRRAVLIGSCSFLSVAMSAVLAPRERISARLLPISLSTQVPEKFEGWHIDNSIVPVLPSADVQSKLATLYNQLIARTYINDSGVRVMISIAYGADQGGDATAAHRPEFCYVAQGFSVKQLGERVVRLNSRSLRVRQLLGKMGPRVEPITYWVTLNDTAVLPGFSRKLEQIKVGLKGYIPDGMLVRASTIGSDVDAGLASQRDFLAALERAMPDALRPRYFGSGVV